MQPVKQTPAQLQARGEPVAVEKDPTQLYVQPSANPSRDERYLAWSRLANALLASGKRKDAEAVWRKVVAIFAKENLPRDGAPAAAAAAQAQFHLLDADYSALVAAKLGQLGKFDATRLGTAVGLQGKRTRALQEAYQAIAEFQAPFWSTGALVRAAKVLQAFARFVYEAPAPPELTDEEHDFYLDVLDRHARPIEDRAVAILEKAAAFAQERALNNEWVRLVKKELALYKPTLGACRSIPTRS